MNKGSIIGIPMVKVKCYLDLKHGLTHI